MLRIRRESSRFRSHGCIHEAAAVRRHVAIGGVGTAWRPALDKVWEFLRTQPGLRADGHNVFLYHHPARCDLAMDADFGVEVTCSFESAGEVYATETPAGMVAVAVYVGLRPHQGNPRRDSSMVRGEQLGLRRKVVGDLRPLVGGSVETRNDYYVYAEVKCRPTINSASG